MTGPGLGFFVAFAFGGACSPGSINEVMEEDLDRKTGEGRPGLDFVTGEPSSLRGISRPISSSDCFDCRLSRRLLGSLFGVVERSRKGRSADFRELRDEREEVEE